MRRPEPDRGRRPARVLPRSAPGVGPWRVECPKSNGTLVTFAHYASETEARAVVAMLASVGCPAVAVGPDGEVHA